MLARRFAEFVLRGRWQAAILAALFSALPFLGWISGVIVGLVTLRKGIMEGFLVMLWAALPSILIFFHWDLSAPFFSRVVFGTFCVWLAAMILRFRGSWAQVLQVIALIGLIGVGVAHAVMHNLPLWWMHQLTARWQAISQNITAAVSKTQQQTFLHSLSLVMTGLQIMFFSFVAIVSTFFARGLESMLFNPGVLNTEIRQVRLSIIASISLVALVILAKVGPSIFIDCLPVMTLPFLLAGVLLGHVLLTVRKVPKVIFIVYYMVLIAVIMVAPQLLLAFVAIAMLDSFFNLRARWVSPAA